MFGQFPVHLRLKNARLICKLLCKYFSLKLPRLELLPEINDTTPNNTFIGLGRLTPQVKGGLPHCQPKKKHNCV